MGREWKTSSIGFYQNFLLGQHIIQRYFEFHVLGSWLPFFPFETKVLDGVPVLWSPMLYSCLIPTIRSQVQKLHEGYECLKIISTIHSFIRVT